VAAFWKLSKTFVSRLYPRSENLGMGPGIGDVYYPAGDSSVKSGMVSDLLP